MEKRKVLFNLLEMAKQAGFLVTGKTFLLVRTFVNRFLHFHPNNQI